ncbi:sulfite exporter TauE/SafE family protein [Flavicella marina]|uniref:sulfite exporter TauE/SafE family protein n=1 Tax=Flavicella marina TaxID=1475951 RepID=UPI001264B19D|nr:sulfite exporter TauE/SafE family protein [Flavicella marina]
MGFEYDWIVLIIIGVFAGALNTLAGGGSLITLPFLIFLGLPPSVANGTNRIAILFQTASAVSGFRSKGINTFPFSLYIGASAFVGSIVGTQIAIDIKGDTFNKILSIIMIVVVLLIVFKKKNLDIQNLSERTTGKHLWLSVVAFFFVGIYGGFINAGIGFIMLLVLPMINRLSLVKANATKVTVAFIYTTIAVVLFVLNDKINWKYGLILAIGNSTGAWLASRYTVKKGDGFIRIVLLVVVSAMAVKLWFF